MQIFLIYLFLYLVGSLLGWVIEVLYRRFFSAKKWVNPGFMKGPWVPLYGFGVIVMFTMCYLCVSFFPDNIFFYNPLGGLFGHNYVSGPTPYDLIPILLMWVGMVLLEFLAGIIFIKGFHVKLWDYSNMKGNILGIICPVFNLIWLSVAIVFYYGINPFLFVISSQMHVYMFGGNGEAAHFGFIFAMGVAYGIMLWDFATSVGLFASVSKFAKKHAILEKYESVREKWEANVKEAKSKMFSIVPEINKGHSNPKGEEIKQKIAEAIFIDPEKEKNKGANYDENGRPVKIETDDKE
jgi:uncharacterized membrane protein